MVVSSVEVWTLSSTWVWRMTVNLRLKFLYAHCRESPMGHRESWKVWRFGWYFLLLLFKRGRKGDSSGEQWELWSQKTALKEDFQRNNGEGINKKKVINSSICSSLTLAFTPLHCNYPGKGTILSPVTILRKIEMGKKDHQMLYCLSSFHIISWG